MKFLLLSLIAHTPDPLTGQQVSTQQRLQNVVEQAVVAEELGYDGFAVGVKRPGFCSAFYTGLRT